MVWLTMGLAWATAIRVPDGQSAEAWEDALALTGLSLATDGQAADAELRRLDGGWQLRVQAADGSWRTASVDAPTDPDQREAIARTVLLMRGPRESVEHDWEMATAPLPPPAPAAAPPPPAWIPPPRFQKAPPTMGPISALRVYPSLTPEQVVSYPEVLQPVPAQVYDGTDPLEGGWGGLGGGGALRAETSFRLHAHADLGAVVGAWRPGLGLGWQQDTPLRALVDIDGSLTTLSAHAAVWRTVWDPGVPLHAGLGGGATRLQFRQAGEPIAALTCPSVLLDLSAGQTLQLYVRVRGDLTRLTISEVVAEDLVGQGTLSPVVAWAGIRLWGRTTR